MGIPFFNGFVSKSLLHHAIVEAQHLASEEALFQASWLKAAEILYIVVSAGTILYLLKMTYYVFFRSPSEESVHHLEKVKEAPGWMLGGVGMLAIGVLVAGLVPGLFLQHLIIPVVEMFKGLDSHGVEQLGNLTVFSWANIREAFLPLALGVGALVIGTSWGLLRNKDKEYYPFHFRLPRWVGVDYWYIQGAQGFISACFLGEKIYDGAKLAARKSATSSVDFARGKSMSLLREYSSDIALGALIIAVSLALLLILKSF